MKEIEVVPYFFRRRKNNFCSQSCYVKFQTNRIIKNCHVCNKEILYKPSRLKAIKGNKFFCSYECKGVYLSKPLDCKCLICSNLFTRTKSQIEKGGGKYCSMRCKGIGESGKNSRFWKDGSAKTPYARGWNKALKMLIKERDGFRCKICGVPQIECILPLAVHHIDYNKNNHSLSNLITLCSSCHTKTTNDREKWGLYFKENICV